MTKEKQGKGVLQKILTGLLTLAMVFTMLNLPMFAQIVKAEDQVQIVIEYVYVNANGENSYYIDTQYVPVGTTWGSFIDNYQRCYSSGIITDADANNEWDMYVQNMECGEEEDSYYNRVIKSEEITNFNQYSDSAYVTFYGYPSTYKYAYFGFEYYKNDELLDSGTGWTILIPEAYGFASDEAIAFVDRNKGIYSYIAELCNTPGVSVSVEGDHEGTDGRWDGYYLKITSSDSSNASGNDNASSNASGNDSGSDNGSSESGQNMRRVSAEGNADISIVGAEDCIPSGAKFTSTELTSGDVYDQAAKIISEKISGATGFRVFDMNLVDESDVAIHQLNGYINVILPIPAGLSADGGKKLTVYRIEEDGSLTKCDTAVNDGYLTFAANHFSTYVIVEEAAAATTATSPKTGEGNMVFIWSLLALAAGGGIVLFMKKRTTCTK